MACTFIHHLFIAEFDHASKFVLNLLQRGCFRWRKYFNLLLPERFSTSSTISSSSVELNELQKPITPFRLMKQKCSGERLAEVSFLTLIHSVVSRVEILSKSKVMSKVLQLSSFNFGLTFKLASFELKLSGTLK